MGSIHGFALGCMGKLEKDSEVKMNDRNSILTLKKITMNMRI